VIYGTIQAWTVRFDPKMALQIRRHLPPAGDKCHIDEKAITIVSGPHWLWGAVDDRAEVLGS